MRESMQKITYILLPVLVYFLLQDCAQILLLFGVNLIVEQESALSSLLLAHTETVNMFLHGCCNLLAALGLLLFWKNTPIKKTNFAEQAIWKRCIGLAGWCAAALGLSIFLNWLFYQIGFTQSNQTYQEVADRQYGVPMLCGILLYAVISPLGEELLFRGILLRRMQRYFSEHISIVISALFFGIFHGNPVQGLYGFLMGLLLGIAQEKTGTLLAPVLCHSVANLFVYLWNVYGA